MRILKRSLLAAVAIYLMLCAAVYLEQSKFIFVPQREVQFTPQDFGCQFQDVRITSAGKTMRGWWLTADPRLSAQMGSRTLIYYHGNGGSIGANAEHACRLRNLGLNVLLFDYRGYGESDDATPTERSVFEDADSAWDYILHVRNADVRKIVIYGHSLGGAVAVEMAKRHSEANALIVESTFTSIRAMADRSPQFRLFPLSMVLNQKMDSLAKVRDIHMPTMFIHGAADRVVPFEMSEQLYAASPATKKLFLVPGAGHENCAAVAGINYQHRILEFLSMAPVPGAPRLRLQ